MTTNFPWVTEPDGGGKSLVLRNASAQTDPEIASNWRASVGAEGNPGQSDSISFTVTSSEELRDFAVVGDVLDH